MDWWQSLDKSVNANAQRWQVNYTGFEFALGNYSIRFVLKFDELIENFKCLARKVPRYFALFGCCDDQTCYDISTGSLIIQYYIQQIAVINNTRWWCQQHFQFMLRFWWYSLYTRWKCRLITTLKPTYWKQTDVISLLHVACSCRATHRLPKGWYTSAAACLCWTAITAQ